MDKSVRTEQKRRPDGARIVLTFLAGATLASSPTLAVPPRTPPVGAELYVIWGYSEAGGHDRIDTAPKQMHGDHIWAVKRNAVTHNPPANTFGSKGPSPNNYFAEELIAEGKATDVVLLKCPGARPGQDWRIGIKGSIDSLNKCTEKVKYAVETWQLKLSGAVTYCCAGDATDEEKARAFPDNYKTLVSAFRSALGNPSLPFVSALTPLTESCDRRPAMVEIIKLLRRIQANTKVTGATWVDFHSVGLPKSCFHLNGQEQAQLGRMMAQATP